MTNRATPASMPRHLTAVDADEHAARQAPDKPRPRICPACNRAPALTDSDVCDFCSLLRERLRIS